MTEVCWRERKKKTQIVERNGGISHPSNNKTVTTTKKRGENVVCFLKLEFVLIERKKKKNAEIRWTITSSLMCCRARKLCLFHFVHTHTPLNQVLVCICADTNTLGPLIFFLLLLFEIRVKAWLVFFFFILYVRVFCDVVAVSLFVLYHFVNKPSSIDEPTNWTFSIC
jgi:hypothetical protein